MYKVSVIVPIFNVELYIERCARSLFEQTLSDVEYIFVDDCSPDQSTSIIEKVLQDYPNRRESVRFVRHAKNRGLTSARNSGLALATGEYIIHCDSDDWVDRSMLEKLYNVALLDDADIVYCDFFMVYKDKLTQYHNLAENDDRVNFLREYLLELTVLWNFIARRELYSRYNLKSPEHITYCEDLHLAIKLYHYANKIKKVDEPLYYYNRANVSSLLNSSSSKAIKDNILVLSEVREFLINENVFGNYARHISWRVLKVKQDLVLDISTHKEFLEILPWAHNYILDNPLVNGKIKLMMWMLVNGMPYITRGIVRLRNILGR